MNPDMSPGASDYDVFISYSSKDQEWVRGELLSRIEGAGCRVFIDFRDFEPGAPCLDECARGVSICRKMLLVLTPNYVDSGWADFESALSQTRDPANKSRRLVPLLKSSCTKPLRIQHLNHIDLTDGADQDLEWRRLLNALVEPPKPKSRFAAVPPTPRLFAGRVEDMDRLDDWIQDATASMYAIWGMGGMGKTSLASAWIHRMSACAPPSLPNDIAGVFWHTFRAYRSGQFTEFVTACSEWLDRTFPAARSVGGSAASLDSLRHRLSAARVLIVWDQFQFCCAASPGPSVVSVPELVEPAIGDFLQWVSQSSRTKLVVMSTEDPSGLLTDCLAYPVEAHRLPGLSEADAKELLGRLGLREHWQSLEGTWRSAEGHPMVLLQAADRVGSPWAGIAPVPKHTATGLPIKTLDETLSRLLEPQRKFLQALSAFGDSPVPLECLERLAQMAELPAVEVEGTIQHFERLGLMSKRPAHPAVHSVVRGLATGQTNSDYGRRVHSMIAQWYASRLRALNLVLDKECAEPRNLLPLRVLIQEHHVRRPTTSELDCRVEYCRHSILGGDYQPAFNMIVNVVADAVYFGYGDYNRLLSLLAELDEGALLAAGDPCGLRMAAWKHAVQGNCLARIGKPDSALWHFDQAIQLYDELERNGQDDGSSKAIARGNRAFDLALMGRLDDSFREQEERSRLLEQVSGGAFQFDLSTAALGMAYVDIIRGRLDAAGQHAERARRLLGQSSGRQGAMFLDVVDILLELARGNAQETLLRRAECVREAARELRFGADIIRGYWLVALAYMGLARKATDQRESLLNAAEEQLSLAREYCDRINLIHMEVELDLAAATVGLLRQDPPVQMVERHARSALRRAQACGARPNEADAHMILAELGRRSGRPSDVHVHEEQARELASCGAGQEANAVHRICARLM